MDRDGTFRLVSALVALQAPSGVEEAIDAYLEGAPRRSRRTGSLQTGACGEETGANGDAIAIGNVARALARWLA